jgi:Zn-finger nucleic acid-binding protein
MDNIAGQTRDPDRALQCPKCSGAMEKVTVAAVTVERCVACHGLWFDAREQEKLRDVPGAEAIDVGPPAAGAATAAASSATSAAGPAGKVMCPVCHTRLIEMTDHRQPHLKYESCTVCYGAFFDAGEFRDYKDVTLAETVRGLFRFGRR